MSEVKREILKFIIGFGVVISIIVFFIYGFIKVINRNPNPKRETISYKQKINLCDCVIYVDEERRIEKIDCKTNTNDKLLRRYRKTQ